MRRIQSGLIQRRIQTSSRHYETRSFIGLCMLLGFFLGIFIIGLMILVYSIPSGILNPWYLYEMCSSIELRMLAGIWIGILMIPELVIGR